LSQNTPNTSNQLLRLQPANHCAGIFSTPLLLFSTLIPSFFCDVFTASLTLSLAFKRSLATMEEYDNDRRAYDGMAMEPTFILPFRPNVNRVAIDSVNDYDREDDREPRDDRRGDEDARARSASPDARDRMDTRCVHR